MGVVGHKATGHNLKTKARQDKKCRDDLTLSKTVSFLLWRPGISMEMKLKLWAMTPSRDLKTFKCCKCSKGR